MSALSIKTINGPALKPYLEQLGRLRIQVFREYPYLYEGDLDYESWYLSTYLACSASFVALVFDGKDVVGATTAIPLKEDHEAFQVPFREQDYPIERIVYFGESILLPAYRGQGLGKQFFELREAYALQFDWLALTTFCAVERPDNHPARPVHYQPLHGFWKRLGYVQTPGLTAQFDWKDIGDKEKTTKPLSFWLKRWKD